MREGARVAAAIAVLEQFERGEGPPDRLLAAWGRANRYAGSGDRAAIGDLVHDALRRRRSLAWRLGDDAPRAALIGLAAARGDDPARLFDGAGHCPAALSQAERNALAAPRPPAPDPVRLDYPDWLDGALRLSLGARFEASMTALQRRAPLDLRVNLSRATPEQAAAALAEDGIATVAAPHAPHGLRAAAGARLRASRAYAEGLVEPQDAASQAAAAFAAAQPGETVLDLCAGGGGKTLALAAAMQGRGRLIAHDAEPARMNDLPARAARAGARVELRGPGALDDLAGRCDLVFVDAPCSGSGSWRRDPGGKWRLTPARLAALVAAQRRILVGALRHLRPGGRLAYATCSLLRAENECAVDACVCSQNGNIGILRTLRLIPADDADGFFCEIVENCARASRG
ncbi:MAG: RsmB/NOP family class I SAM-dependent RNA methyltransferase [Rubrimonas sp.]|uniref:RsmB/NOP family class I SAM-dependent RNA methyltransferase n=1 Tax=Rubrimonas sp. TaxID=2036015 RepID=UPI002FDE2D0E